MHYRVCLEVQLGRNTILPDSSHKLYRIAFDFFIRAFVAIIFHCCPGKMYNGSETLDLYHPYGT